MVFFVFRGTYPSLSNTYIGAGGILDFSGQIAIGIAILNQGGCRYFSRREITALVGGPGNMAVYRHSLVIPVSYTHLTLPTNREV